MIRPACDDDAARIAEVHLAAWRQACRDILSAEQLAGVSLERRTSDWVHRLALPGSWTYVSEREGRLVGFVTLASVRAHGRPSRTVVELRMLYVDPDHWRTGIGRALLEQVRAVARERGFQRVVLWVLTGNIQARAFYAALGFEPDRTRQIPIGGQSVDETRYCLPV